jgi:hypothetical protein
LQPLTAISKTSAKPHVIFPPKADRRADPNLAGFLALNPGRREPSFNARALDLASDLGDNRAGPNINVLEALPASFGTQMEMATQRQQYGGGDSDTARGLNKLVLARMSTLEQGFAEVLKEVKGLSRGASSAGNSSVEGNSRGKRNRNVIGAIAERRAVAVRMARHEPEDEDAMQAAPGASNLSEDDFIDHGDETVASRSSV